MITYVTNLAELKILNFYITILCKNESLSKNFVFLKKMSKGIHNIAQNPYLYTICCEVTCVINFVTHVNVSAEHDV